MPNSQLRVLIIDDEDADREDLAEWLTRRERMAVSTAASAKEGLRLLHEANGRFDAMILDQVLPDIDGIEVTRWVRAEYPSIFIVMLTGQGLSAGLEVLRAGAYRYIPKPADNEEIAFLLKHIVEIRQMEQRLLEEGKLVNATRAIAEHASSSSRSDLLNHIAQGASQLLDVPICIVWELDLADQRFKIAAHFGPVDAEYRQSVSINSREEVTRKFLEAREPLVLTDIQSSNAYQHKKEAAARGWKSLRSMPLASQERVFAILDVISCETRAFAPWEKQSLATFAAQAALAIRQAGLLQHFQEIGRLALARNVEALMDYVVDAVSDLTGTVASLWMIEKAAHGDAVLRIRAGHGLRKEYMETACLSLDPNLSVVAAGIAQRKPISRPDIFDDTTLPPFHYKEEAVRRGWKSFLSVPLLRPTGQALGALSVYGSSVREFSKGELELLRSFANQAAIALEDLLERDRLESLAKLGEAISGKIISGTKPILEEAAATACTLMDADSAAIYPYDPDRELFYDLGNVVIHPANLSVGLQSKPRERGLATKVRQLGELIVTDTETGESGVIGFADLGEKGVDAQDLLALIRDAHFIKRHQIKAFIGLSLGASLTEATSSRVREEVGVLYINYCAPHDFTEEELNLVRIFGHQLANAIHTARLLEKERRLNKQANALRDVAEAIASPDLKPAQVAEKILDELQEIIAYKTATLQLIQKDGDTRELIAARGFSDKKANPYDAHLLRPLSKDNLIREVVASKGPYILPDTQKWKDWGNNPNTAHVRSWACVPLVHGETVVGLLTLDHDTPEFYQPVMKNTLAAFGSQAAVAIRNQQLWGELQRQVKGHKALNQVAGDLIGAQSEEETLQIAVAAAIKALECVHCTGFHLHDDKIAVVASEGNRSKDFPIGRTFDLGAGVAGWVAQEGKSALVSDTRTDKRFSSGWSHPDPLALAVVPIFLDGRVYGVISAEDDNISAFDKSDLRLLETLVSQVSQTIKNVRLHAVEQRRTEQLKHLSDVALAMTKMTGEKASLRATLEDVLRGIDPILGVEASACVNLYDATTDSFGESFVSGPLAKRLQTHRPRANGTGAWVVRNKTSIFVDDVASETTGSPQMREDFRDQVQSYAVLPLLVGKEVLGTLYLDLGQKYTFSPEIQELLWLFARQAAVAIENARLLTDARSRLEQLNALQEASHGIVQELDPKKLLPIVIERAAELIAGGDKRGIGAAYWRCDHETGKIINEYSRNPDLEGSELDFKTGLVGKVSRTGKGDYINDYPNSPARALDLDQELVNKKLKNLIAVPVREYDEVVAVLVISSDAKRDRRFGDADISLLERFADLTLIATKNASLHERVVQAIAAFQRVNAAIPTAGIAEVRELILQQLQEVVAYDSASIQLLVDESLEIQACRGFKRPEDILGKRFPLDRKNPNFEVIKSQKPIVVEDTARHYAHMIDELGRPRFWLGVPLREKNAVIGMIALDRMGTRPFTDWEQRQVEAFANQASITIQNARLYDQLNSANRQLSIANDQLSVAFERQKAVSEVGAQLTANIHLSEAEILTLLHQQTSLVMDTRNMYIALYDESTDTVRFSLAYLGGKQVDTSREKGWQPRSGGHGRTEWIIRNRQPLLDRTRAESEAWYNAPGREEYIGQVFNSWVGVPMIVGDHVLGVIATYHPDRENAYGEDDVQVLSMMAGYAAIALDNARLLQELENRLMELGKLRELSEELSAGVWLGGE